MIFLLVGQFKIAWSALLADGVTIFVPKKDCPGTMDTGAVVPGHGEVRVRLSESNGGIDWLTQ
jgi:hypothetical protein